MTISVKFVTVVIRIETIEKKYSGGLKSFIKDYTINPSFRDRYLVGVIFMGTDEAEEFIQKLINLGFSYIVNNECDEIAIVDQFEGLFMPCPWLETSIMALLDRKDVKEIKESTCWYITLNNLKKAIPPGLVKCPVCGEYKGTVKDSELNGNSYEDPDEVLMATCLCDGILCRRCNKNKIHRPISNSYYPETNELWHHPYFSAGIPCDECREKEQKKNKKAEKSRIHKKRIK